MQYLFGTHIVKLRFNRWRGTEDGSLLDLQEVAGEMLDELQWPILEAQRGQSSLLFFHKIHCGTMSIDNLIKTCT